ncbi:Helix-turn-helix domain protein [compost metagenome]
MNSSDLPEICTPDQVAEYIGVSRNTIYAWCNSGDLESIKIRKVRRIRKTTLLAWLDEREKASCISVE